MTVVSTDGAIALPLPSSEAKCDLALISVFTLLLHVPLLSSFTFLSCSNLRTMAQFRCSMHASGKVW